jgi:hypothetical protein
MAEVESRPVQPVKAGTASPGPQTGGSGSYPVRGHSKFFPANEPLPVGLSVHLDAPVTGGTAAGCEQLNRGALLIRAQDPNFACCWFSRPLDFGAARGEPAFWVLQKTARDRWLLCLRRGSGDVAEYHLKTRKHAFPIALKRGRVSREFADWPGTVTVRWAQ